MSLDRLLIVVVLSPAQACFVAARLLEAVQVQGATNGSRPHDVGCRWTVAVTPAGEIEVSPVHSDEGARLPELLERLSHHARRLPAHPGPERLALLRRLEEAASSPSREPAARARELDDAVAEVLGPGARERLTGQLAALVGAFARVAPSVAAPADALAAHAGTRSDGRRAAMTHPASSRGAWRAPVPAPRHHRVRTRRIVLVALLLVAAAGGSGYVLLNDPESGTSAEGGRDRSTAGPGRTGPSDSDQEQAQSSRSRARSGVESIAPRRAGPVTGVTLQKAGDCSPGAPCPVTVTTRFRPDSTVRPVTWRVGTARSCKGSITWSPPVTVTAQPGWTRVYASSSVAVSEGPSPALVAVTTAPARAQSEPVPVTGSSLRC